ncbi:hypothetical protein ACMSSJ_13805 [Kerstersia gyiorum]|uniref:hypothetical protein n=1 Tax=Kerstersia gyiorum TaxID=206506 RepID=UPI0039ED49A5
MKKMTSDQIRTRLAEIKAEQAAHEARDFDAELLALMQSGGDVDALESQQLDAERAARRLRVEAQALKAMLPDAVRIEVRQAVGRLAESGKADHEALNQHIDDLIALDQKRLEIYAAIEEIQGRQDAAMEQAREITGAGKVGDVAEFVDSKLASELLALMTQDGRDMAQIPEPTRGALQAHLNARGIEQDRARHATFMKQLAAEKAA